MKVLELIETVDFQNQNITSQHLFKVQKARCDEFLTYLIELMSKYPKLSRGPVNTRFPMWGIPSTDRNLSWRSYFKPNVDDRKILTSDEIKKYRQKYVRMIQSKQMFEEAGGNYQEYFHD